MYNPEFVGYAAKCISTGKFITKGDKYHHNKPELWTGTDVSKARIYRNIGHLKASVGVQTPEITEFPDGYCRRCGRQRDKSHKRCHECGGMLGGRIVGRSKNQIPETVKVVMLGITEMED